MGMSVDESVGLTDAEANVVSNRTDVVSKSWTVSDVSAGVEDKDGNTTGYGGSVYTKNTKGDFINTGVKVNSGAIQQDNGQYTSNNTWISPAYQKKLR